MNEEQEPVVEPVPIEEPAPETDEIVAEGEEALARMRQMSRRSLILAGVVTVGALGGMQAFEKFAPEDGTGIKSLFRNALLWNEGVARRVFFSETHRDKEFPRARAVTPKNNYHGETPVVDQEAWRLTLEGAKEGQKSLTLADLKALPEVSQTTELKCVEGWSAIVHWTGVRFADFVKQYPPPEGTRYVAMRSEPEGYEDDWYYVGLDMESCLHPQTLLAYGMNDQPLPVENGAPLRLVMPHKYGIKNIKLITHITYSAERPADYWERMGYDWYAGL
jgi:DMSO/TMAO reductase YedYZ molybdopterin-dependent catalytic subunit